MRNTGDMEGNECNTLGLTEWLGSEGRHFSLNLISGCSRLFGPFNKLSEDANELSNIQVHLFETKLPYTQGGGGLNLMILMNDRLI